MINGIPSPTAARVDGFAANFFWAVFLGVSWTWVIGMFVPVLLVRNFGLWGWVVFAVPNVVGAAAMGWVLRDGAASERFVRRHAGACCAFSLVTIAYHVFFAMWMIHRLTGWGFYALAIYLLAALVPANMLTRRAGSLLALLISIAIWYMLDQQGVLAVPSATPLGEAGINAIALICLTPALVIGFALCPYLDLTFHRARQSTSPAGGRFAFGFGFGVIFFAMIVFTLLYARLLSPAVEGQPLTQLTTLFLTLHFVGQSAFTVAAHVRELPLHGVRREASRFLRLAGIGAALFLMIAVALGWYASTPRHLLGHDLGEVVYWCFLSFYGLVFPGYLWLTWGSGLISLHAQRAVLTLLAICSIVAFPLYWMGFVEKRTFWLIPGVVVLLSSRLFVRRGRDESGAVAAGD